ncbi:hypothetical protein F3Y22_tig00110053pilonHSYRG00032 [Hibiscus syriacus]|uniref:Uncharacterized protein n=1 Tax=Hibiscus syriacus TaxID=106335 RepID=A0A6A3BJT2_HIBSY|nr:hypothetical protein F3Y22_tig00110053pilonHSYRG00032 [Hibiscus syriacus]
MSNTLTSSPPLSPVTTETRQTPVDSERHKEHDGAGGLESSAVSEDTVDLLDTVKVFDLNGNEIPISDLWKDRKAVVAFARHFG